jgi:hypothetical protein
MGYEKLLGKEDASSGPKWKSKEFTGQRNGGIM